jgi:hypothetical protein
MLNISKYHKVLVGCSAIATVASTGLVQSASAAEFNGQSARIDRSNVLIAQTTPTNNSNASGSNVTTTNNSNASGGNVTTINNPSVGGSTSTSGGSSPAISGRATTISSRVGVAQANFNQAAANVAQSQAAQPVAPDLTPVRFSVDKGVADLASCGCPNADTVGTASSPTPSPELVAAKAAEADAAAELAAAKAEARQFIESVQNGSISTSSTASSQLW